MLPEIKKIIRSVKFSEAQKIAKQVLMLKTEDEIKETLKSFMTKRFPDIPID
jgi:phosphoenolpyruvate-protein kinase (PTS system EI component)